VIIWCTEIGEPLPFEKDARLHRYGLLTRHLASAGHDVVWWTSNFSHAPKAFVVEGDRDYQVDGVTLRVLQGIGYKRNVSFQRIRHQRHFSRQFFESAQKLPPPHVILSSLPTIEAACMAVRYAKNRGVPVLIDIADVWPDELVDLAPQPLRWAARLLFKKAYQEMRFVCTQATGILSICRNYLDYGLSFTGRQQGENDGIFPLGYSAEPVHKDKIETAWQWWQEQGVRSEAFVCCFFGTIGKFFQMETVIQTAKMLSNESDVQFVLCGDGSNLASYQKKAADVPNVIFPGWVDAPKIAALMSRSQVGLAPYAQGTRMSLPNKPFEYFAGGLPVISSIQGELKEILDESQCGLTYQADSVQELMACIRKLTASENLCSQMRQRAKALFNDKYTTEAIFSKLNQHIYKVAHSFKRRGNQ